MGCGSAGGVRSTCCGLHVRCRRAHRRQRQLKSRAVHLAASVHAYVALCSPRKRHEQCEPGCTQSGAPLGCAFAAMALRVSAALAALALALVALPAVHGAAPGRPQNVYLASFSVRCARTHASPLLSRRRRRRALFAVRSRAPDAVHCAAARSRGVLRRASRCRARHVVTPAPLRRAPAAGGRVAEHAV